MAYVTSFCTCEIQSGPANNHRKKKANFMIDINA